MGAETFSINETPEFSPRETDKRNIHFSVFY